MTQSGYDTAGTILPKRASGYEQGPQGLVNARSISMTRPQGAGALYCRSEALFITQHIAAGVRFVIDFDFQAILQAMLTADHHFIARAQRGFDDVMGV